MERVLRHGDCHNCPDIFIAVRLSDAARGFLDVLSQRDLPTENLDRWHLSRGHSFRHSATPWLDVLGTVPVSRNLNAQLDVLKTGAKESHPYKCAKALQ